MDRRKAAASEAGHLTQVREGLDVPSGCFLPPIVRTGSEPGGGEAGGQEPVPAAKQSLLDELGRIEADLRQCLRLEVERQREADFLRQRENNLQRTHLCHLTLSQRVAKPWVNSYFRRFPMHIYCLPVQAANQRARRGARKRRK